MPPLEAPSTLSKGASNRVFTDARNSLSRRDTPKRTLDEISKSNPVLLQQLSNDFDCAYNKAKYYDIVADSYNNNKEQARYKLRVIFTSKIEYFLLYLLLFMPISNKLILKLLGR